MVEFLGGIAVTLFLGLSAVIGYVAGVSQKTKPNLPKTEQSFDETSEKEKNEQEKYRKDFNVMWSYNQNVAYQPKRELGE